MLVWLSCLLQIVALRIDAVCNDQFDCAFGASVWVCRANWAVFRDGDHAWMFGRIAVDGRRGGEDDIRYIVFFHAAEESDGSANINAVVFERDLRRFSNGLVATVRMRQHKLWAQHTLRAAK